MTKMLILDDDFTILEILSRSIAQYDPAIEIQCAQSFSKAKEILTKDQIHLVLMDTDLGEGTGDHMFPYFSNALYKIGMSGSLPSDEIRQKFDAFLEKPFSIAQLHPILDRFFNV